LNLTAEPIHDHDAHNADDEDGAKDNKKRESSWFKIDHIVWMVSE
jgi:hypothetical protein